MKNFLFALVLIFANTLAWAEDALTHYVLVSVAPYKYFIEKIAGDTVKVGLMVPPGASAHTYEPSPKEMMAASHADAWFLIGESFETRATKAIKSHHPQIVFYDLRKGVDLIVDDPHHQHCRCHPNCQDLHIWLSPRQSKIQAAILTQGLSTLYPEHQALYASNLQKLLGELEALDREIAVTLQPLKERFILVSHPAYAYFCRDYQLEQRSIEFEGKDPTPKQLTQVIALARQHHVKSIFIQPQYNNKGARLIAQQLGAQVVDLDPYSENYFVSLRAIAKAFAMQ